MIVINAAISRCAEFSVAGSVKGETMAVKARIIQTAIGAIAPFVILSVLTSAASADCAKDLMGEVYCGGGRCLVDRSGAIWCSRSYEGGAAKLRDGSVVCGRGQCATDSRGRAFCSSEVGGAVLIDSAGRVRCYGRCERAGANQCEHTPAGSSG